MADMATREQILLLSRLQSVGLYQEVNPMTLTNDKAEDLFKNLPSLEWISAEGRDSDGNSHFEDFIGCSEYDTQKQLTNWLTKNNYDLEHKSNPEFGGGLLWLDYFRQPQEQINFTALTKHFKDWNLPLSSSKLEILFNDMTPEKFAAYRASRADKAQYAILRSYLATGKMPRIPKDAYMSLTMAQAQDLIVKYQDAPETIKAIPTEIPVEKESFPDFKEVHLLSEKKANYLQRSILRELIAEGKICSPENRKELQKKFDFITEKQAEVLIKTHENELAGENLLSQCKGYIESGKIIDLDTNWWDQTKIKDVQSLFNTYRGQDWTMRSAVLDLIDGGYLGKDKELLKSKAVYMPDALMEKLTSKYGDAPIGSHMKSLLNDLIDSGEIGSLDEKHLAVLTVCDARNLVDKCDEIEHSQHHKPLTAAQRGFIEKLAKNGFLDLSKIDFSRMSIQGAKQCIELGLKNQNSVEHDFPASVKQRGLLKKLVEAKLLNPLPYAEWKNLSSKKASELIQSVPQKELEKISSTRENEPVKTNTEKEKGISL